MLSGMAVGVMGGTRGVPMSHRVRGAGATYDSCPARHCWVADAVDGFGIKRPGLLLEWRRTGDTWEGRVVYAAQLRPGRWVMVEEWAAEALLTPL